MLIGAPIAPQRLPALRELLEGMNKAPGQLDPANKLVPFAEFAQLHTARFVIVDDPSLSDRIGHAPSLPVEEPDWLVFLAICDCSEEHLIAEMVQKAEVGIRAIFGACIGFDASTPLGQWLRDHRLSLPTTYQNWPGRSIMQIREEAELHDRLLAVRLAHPNISSEELAPLLREAGATVGLTPLPSPSLLTRIGNILHFLLLPLYALLLTPILLPLLPLLLVILRWREKRDPVLTPRRDRVRNNALLALEDHDVANPYSVVGSRKPGIFWRLVSVVGLWLINWGGRHLYYKGRLARVNTIHHASWAYIDDGRRMFFGTVYDGSREAYNDDFVNKVAFGLNLSFASALGWPRTRWVLFDGARHEQDFKNYLARHQLSTQAWYTAYPGLTTYDLARNTRIREGFEKPLSGAALRHWIAEI